MRTNRILKHLLIVTALLMICSVSWGANKLKTQNVIFMMTDGLRWQEVFRGADSALINKDNGVADEAALQKKYWKDNINERRAALMPFMWNVVAKQGQIFGNRDKESICRVENPYWFSYPGYSETFCGYVDTKVNSNSYGYNPNMSVFEWLVNKPAYKNKVAAFGAWDAFPFILNRSRANFYINANTEPVLMGKISPKQDLLNHLKAECTSFDPSEPPDAITFYSAMEYLKQNKPRIFYVSLGWTDEAAHLNRYDEYLKAANLADKYFQIMWDTIQLMPQYKGKTTLILATDHGRGSNGGDWRTHSSGTPGSNENWMAYIGPDTPALGERSNAPEVTSSHIAATLAAFLGENYKAAVPKAGAPIEDVIKGISITTKNAPVSIK